MFIQKVALKTIDKGTLNSIEVVNRLRREINISKLLDHPHIVRLIDVVETESKIYMIMEYIQGKDLFQCVLENERFEESAARKYYRQLASAIYYLHKNGIVHRGIIIHFYARYQTRKHHD